MIGAVLTALAAVADQLPPAWQPYILVAAIVVGTVSGWMATSLLPGENDATKRSANRGAKLLLPFVIFGALSVAACRPPASIQTEPGRQAWYASQVLQRVSEVQNSAIQLNSTTPPSLSTNTTRVIVQMCVSSAKVLKEMPNGWAKVVLASFNETKAQIPTAELNKNVTLQTALAVLEGILISFAGGTP